MSDLDTFIRQLEASVAKQQPAFDPAAEATRLEQLQGTGTFTDATNAILAGIPFGEEIVSGMHAPFRAAREAIQGEPFSIGQAYERNLAVERELQRRREERSPVASTVGAVAGGLGLGGVAAKGGLTFLQGAKPTAASLIGRGAAEGGAYGALYGAGAGQGTDDRIMQALTGAGTGAALGAGVGAIGRALVGRGPRPPATPTAEDIRGAAQQAYQRADDAGVIFKPESIQRLSRNITKELTDFGYHPSLHPRVGAVLQSIDDLKGQNITFKGLQTIRRIANNARTSLDASERTIGGKIVDAIDDIATNPKAAEVLTGDAQAGSRAMREGTQLWKRAKKTELIEEAFTKAERRAASTGSGGNVENAMRQNIRGILDNAKNRRLFSKAEQEAMDAFVRGTKGQNIARLIGKLSPQGSGLMAALGIGGTAANPLLAAFPAAGMVAKGLAQRGAQAGAQAVRQSVATGEAATGPVLTKGRQALVQALARAGGQFAPR